MKIQTNNVPRSALYGYELTDKERKEFDYIPDDEIMTRDFIRYKGSLYDVGDIMLEKSSSLYTLNNGIQQWDGYVSDSFFFGVLFKYIPQDDKWLCATYYS